MHIFTIIFIAPQKQLVYIGFMSIGDKIEIYIKDNGLSDARLGDMLEPKVTGACVWGWRHGRSEPDRPYRRQLIDITKGYISAEDFI
jgi:hypothetical protein